MAREVNVPDNRLFIGEDKTLEIPVVNEDSDLPRDLSGDALVWYMRADPALTGTLYLTKRSADGDVTLIQSGAGAEQDPEVEDDVACVRIYDTDTWDGSAVLIPPGEYHMSLWKEDAGEETLLAWGIVPLRAAAGRGSNS